MTPLQILRYQPSYLSGGVQHIFCSSKIFSKILLYILIEGDVKKHYMTKKSSEPSRQQFVDSNVGHVTNVLLKDGVLFFLYLQCHKTCLNKISLYLRFCDMEVYERESLCIIELRDDCVNGDGGEM